MAADKSLVVPGATLWATSEGVIDNMHVLAVKVKVQDEPQFGTVGVLVEGDTQPQGWALNDLFATQQEAQAEGRRIVRELILEASLRHDARVRTLVILLDPIRPKK